MIREAAGARVVRAWDSGPRFDLDLRSPLAADGWAWRTIAPGHAVLRADPQVLRRSDPGDALGVIAGKYGQPTSYCVLGGNVASVSGWEGITFAEQYEAVTRRAGAFPCGGMYYLSVTGEHAASVLNLLTPRRIDLLEVGRAVFVVFTTPEGSVDTEGVVLRDGEDSYLVSVGGDTRPPTWLHDALDSYPHAQAAEAGLSSFNLKGPKRLEAMGRLVSHDYASRLAALKPFQGLKVRTRWGGEAWVVRTLIGIELWASPDVIHEAWREIVADPDCFTPCGWDVLATFRMECTEFVFYLCPLDIHRGTYVWDVGLGHVLSRGKDSSFIGREALAHPARFGRRMWIAGLMAVSPDATPRRIGEPVYAPGSVLPYGYVTSAGYSPRAGRELCFAHLSTAVGPNSTVRFDDGTSWRATELPMAIPPGLAGSTVDERTRVRK